MADATKRDIFLLLLAEWYADNRSFEGASLGGSELAEVTDERDAFMRAYDQAPDG